MFPCPQESTRLWAKWGGGIALLRQTSMHNKSQIPLPPPREMHNLKCLYTWGPTLCLNFGKQDWCDTYKIWLEKRVDWFFQVAHFLNTICWKINTTRRHTKILQIYTNWFCKWIFRSKTFRNSVFATIGERYLPRLVKFYFLSIAFHIHHLGHVHQNKTIRQYSF